MIKILSSISIILVLTCCCKFHTEKIEYPSIPNYYLRNRCDIHPGYIDMFVSNGIIILVDNYNLRIQAFSEKTKKQLWLKKSKELLLNTTEVMGYFYDLNYESFVNEDRIFLINKENITCIDINTGKIVWKKNFSMGEYSIDSFAKSSYDSRYIYFYIAGANFRSYFFKINIKDGALLEKGVYKKIHFLGRQFHNGDSIYVMGKEKTGKIYLFNISQHNLKIKKKSRLNERNIYSVNMLLDQDNLYIIDGNEFKSVSIPAMDIRWQVNLDLKPGFQLYLYNDTLYVIGNYYFFINAINKNTGKMKWNNTDYSQILWCDKKFYRRNYTYYIPRPFHHIEYGNKYLSLISEFELRYISSDSGKIMKQSKIVEDENEIFYFWSTDSIYKYSSGKIFKVVYDNGNIINSLFLEAN